MERSASSWACVFALVALPVGGCSEETTAAGGSGGSGGMGGGGTGGSTGDVFPCTEQGIRDAIAEGGGPHTFDCDGPQTVVTQAEIVIDNGVILNGEGNLTVDGNDDHRVFSVSLEATVELWGFEVTGGAAVTGSASDRWGGGIHVSGTLTLKNSTVSGNTAQHNGGGIAINNGNRPVVLANSTVSGNSASEGCCGGVYLLSGTLTLTNSTVSGNTAEEWGGGILCVNGTNLTLTNSTVSGNSASAGGGIVALGSPKGGSARLTLTGSTVSGNTADSGGGIVCDYSWCTIVGSLVDGDCVGDFAGDITSNGYNIESPGNTCGFDQPTDQVDVTELNLGPLQDNGGPTMTHAVLPGSVAIDVIPADMCEVDEDQRGEPRPGGAMCDVGAFEVQEGSL